MYSNVCVTAATTIRSFGVVLEFLGRNVGNGNTLNNFISDGRWPKPNSQVLRTWFVRRFVLATQEQTALSIGISKDIQAQSIAECRDFPVSPSSSCRSALR